MTVQIRFGTLPVTFELQKRLTEIGILELRLYFQKFLFCGSSRAFPLLQLFPSFERPADERLVQPASLADMGVERNVGYVCYSG
jgi:hypothetical protein